MHRSDPKRPRKFKTLFNEIPVLDPVISARSYWIWLDETGSEDFGDHTLFGFAGVAGYGVELHRADRKWRTMKAAHFGGAHAPLHASGKMMSREQLDAISIHFLQSRLKRFAFIMAAPKLKLPGIDGLSAMREFLLDQLVEHISDLPKLPDDVHVAFETSERLLPKMLSTFPGLQFSVDDQERQVVVVFADKGRGFSWLEMADQLAHRAQRQHRIGFPAETPLPEFEAVFPAAMPPHVRLTLLKLSTVKYETSGIEFGFETDGLVRFRVDSRARHLLKHFGTGPNPSKVGPEETDSH